jgi:hypothetical protein
METGVSEMSLFRDVQLADADGVSVSLFGSSLLPFDRLLPMLARFIYPELDRKE